MIAYVLLVVALIVVFSIIGTLIRNSDKRARQNFDDIKVTKWHAHIVSVAKPFYEGGGRFYHNWTHIQEGLDFIDEAPEGMFEKSDVIAWIFHDVVYIPGDPDNEKRSSELLVKLFNSGTLHGLKLEEVRSAAGKINNTVNHMHPGCLVCNVDLLRLASVKADFIQNNHDIFHEYSDLCGGDISKFAKGQIAFCEAYLSRDLIFTHPAFSKYEVQARRNLTNTIEWYSDNPDQLLG